ncbi:hypothetical protein [Chryseobacterium sp. Marseille-Q8038]
MPQKMPIPYYVYMYYNQLAFVIPPKTALESDPNTVLNDLCYQYKYDRRNRLVEKLPKAENI